MSRPTEFITDCVRAGIGSDTAFGAVMPPIHLSSNYTFSDIGDKPEFDYTRSGNPTRSLLADTIAGLEEAAGGVVTSSGMSAITTVLHHLRPGSRILVAHDCYGGVDRLLRALAARGAVEFSLFDLTDTASAIAEITRTRPDAVWIETPSNPLLRITDIEAVSTAAHRVDATVVVDNTFLSPALQQPIRYGADIVVHSTTKFLNGHSDVVGGAVVAADPSRVEDLAWWANCLGVTGSPFDSYLTLRGIRTLHARVRSHEGGAEAVVDALVSHPAVSRVHYPGLPGHPGNPTAACQQRGFGSLLSFELEGGLPAARRFVGALSCFSLAESLGGVESLVCHPATMTHAAMDENARRHAGIHDSLLRISVGIEDPATLASDVLGALESLRPATSAPLPAQEAEWSPR